MIQFIHQIVIDFVLIAIKPKQWTKKPSRTAEWIDNFLGVCPLSHLTVISINVTIYIEFIFGWSERFELSSLWIGEFPENNLLMFSGEGAGEWGGVGAEEEQWNCERNP